MQSTISGLHRWLLLGVWLVVAGCAKYEPAPMPGRQRPAADQDAVGQRPGDGKQTPSSTSSSSPSAAVDRRAASAAGPNSSAPTGPSTQSPAVHASPLPPEGKLASGNQGEYPARLSAGVALPQTLPNGTQMGFSVDYQLDGAAVTSGVYWVIERSRGQPARLPVQLQSSGNLATFLPWQPEDGPFQCRLERSAAAPLSATVPMR